MIFQSFNLVPHMTVLENVIEVPVHVHGENPGIVRERALNLLARVGLAWIFHTNLKNPGWLQY